MNKETTGKVVISLLKAAIKQNSELRAELDQLKQRVSILEKNVRV